MNAIANLAATLRADLGECLADLAVDALIDEAELSPKPALVDRRGNGAHADLHLGLMQASALSLWPCFKEMADAAQRHGRIDARLRAAARALEPRHIAHQKRHVCVGAKRFDLEDELIDVDIGAQFSGGLCGGDRLAKPRTHRLAVSAHTILDRARAGPV
ncbi:triphosphoribosyl-dephospho-CoA synthase, partial [Pseudomonas aeruginosa]|nr:triphosphoribosyl-dephospho-CoA synthase [Pseudomonas aeruginosa]